MFLFIIALIILGKLIPHWHRKTCLMKAGLTELKSETENWKTDLSLGFKQSITFNFNVLNFKSTDISLSSLYSVKQKTTAYILMSFFCARFKKLQVCVRFFKRAFRVHFGPCTSELYCMKKNNFQLHLTKQFKNILKLWCEWGISHLTFHVLFFHSKISYH